MARIWETDNRDPAEALRGLQALVDVLRQEIARLKGEIANLTERS